MLNSHGVEILGSSYSEIDMSAEPHGWNVVLLGRWNTAIFTPEWIAKRLFGLGSGEAVEVAISLDEALPHRLKLRDLTVIPTPAQLVVAPNRATYDDLDAARQIAKKALSELPETPVAAVGFNVRFGVETPSAAVLESVAPRIDQLLSDIGHTIDTRTIKRSLKFGDGLLNLSITVSTEATAELEFNFHRGSAARDELTTWLSQPIQDVRDAVKKLGTDVLGMELSESGATKHE